MDSDAVKNAMPAATTKGAERPPAIIKIVPTEGPVITHSIWMLLNDMDTLPILSAGHNC